MKRLIRTQNTQGYINSQDGSETANVASRGVSAKATLAQGALNSSKANINVARFDTVPLIRFYESNHWFGKSRRGE